VLLHAETIIGFTDVDPEAAVSDRSWKALGQGHVAPAVRIRWRCEMSTNFDYNLFYLTPSCGRVSPLAYQPRRT